jgi:hypothetical protein
MLCVEVDLTVPRGVIAIASGQGSWPTQTGTRRVQRLQFTGHVSIHTRKCKPRLQV